MMKSEATTKKKSADVGHRAYPRNYFSRSGIALLAKSNVPPLLTTM